MLTNKDFAALAKYCNWISDRFDHGAKFDVRRFGSRAIVETAIAPMIIVSKDAQAYTFANEDGEVLFRNPSLVDGVVELAAFNFKQYADDRIRSELNLD